MADLSLVELFGYFFAGLGEALSPATFLALCAGLFMGFWVGILPGVGGPATLAILIPFTFTMEPFPAFALLLGMISVASTAGDMTAILFGIPGESANAATVLDGSPMAKRGEAGRALGAVLTASLMGAVIGAFCLALGIIIIRPLVLSVGYAEFFMLSLAGIAFLASLSASAVFKGMTAGALGLLLATIGMSQVTGIERYTFGALFLWDGLGFIPAILGLFAIPELIDMATGKKQVHTMDRRISGAWRGVKDTVRHSGLVFRCSVIATYIGLIPGMGASISQWVAYGHAIQSVKRKETIGRGAIEGVIGPGAANNATMSGSLVPTIGFGVPGSPQMAILLGAFIIQGLVPGPAMLTPEEHGGHLTLTFSMVWMIILSNLVVVVASFFVLNQIAKVAYLDVHILIPFILVLIFIGGFANQNDLTDMWVCLGFGLLGWIMVALDWPRPPLILGLVLGSLIESNLFLTVQAYGMAWIRFPSVILIFAVIVASVAWPFLKPWVAKRRARYREVPVLDTEEELPDLSSQAGSPGAERGDLVLCTALALLFITAIVESWNWSQSARLMPLTMAIFGLTFAMVQAALSLRSLRFAPSRASRWFAPAQERQAGLFVWQAYLILFALVFLLGFAAAAGVFLIVYLMAVSRIGFVRAAVASVTGASAVHLGFDRALGLPFPPGWLFDVGLPALGIAI